MAEKLLALRYMTQFRCTGPLCEDPCCGGWNIFVDEPGYRRLELAAHRSPSLREQLDLSLERPGPSGWFAKVRAHADGNCGFFEDGFCALHRDLGESVLPGTCATYPRTVAHVGNRCELSGTLSCPEAARLCLCEPDAMDLVEASWEMLPEHCLVTREVPHTESHYTGRFDQVRAVVLDLLGLEAYPLEERLFFVMYFSNQTSSFFQRDRGADPDSRLEQEIIRVKNRAFLAELARDFRCLRTSEEFALDVVFGLLQSSLDQERPRRYRALCTGVLQSYGIQRFDQFADAALREGIGAEYVRRRERAMKRFAGRIETILTRYAQNYWVREPYTQSPDLLSHTRDLVVRLALVKFLFFSHPDLEMLLEEDETRHEPLDRIAIEVVQTFARNVEHDNAFLERARNKLLSRGATGLSHLSCLARL